MISIPAPIVHHFRSRQFSKIRRKTAALCGGALPLPFNDRRAFFSLFSFFPPPSPFLRAAIIKTIHKPSNNGRLINRGRGSSRLRNEARASKFDKMDSPLFSIRPMTNGRERKIKRQHTICIFAWRGRGLSVNRQAPYSSTRKRSKAFPTLDQSVKRNTGFEGLRNQPTPSSAGPLRTGGYPQCATRERCTNKGG